MSQSQTVPTTGTLCVLTHLDNGIYCFTSKANSRDAVDEYLEQTESVYRVNEKTPLLRFLIDASQAVLPFNYLMPRLQILNAKYPNRPKARMAFLMDNALVSLLAGLTRLLGLKAKDDMRFFKPSQREAAILWLLADD